MIEIGDNLDIKLLRQQPDQSSGHNVWLESIDSISIEQKKISLKNYQLIPSYVKLRPMI